MYHGAIQNQKKAHWHNFLSNNTNIWQAARYIDPTNDSYFDKTSSLIRKNDSITAANQEQTIKLLNIFFSSLPKKIQDESLMSAKESISMPHLMLQEVECRIMAVSP